jgi:hypothetical protein
VRLKLRVYHAKCKARQEDSNGQNDCIPESVSAIGCSKIRVLKICRLTAIRKKIYKEIFELIISDTVCLKYVDKNFVYLNRKPEKSMN